MPAQQGHGRRAIESALLEFQQAPARHIVALRQPAVLFASMREVLQIAGERSADDDGPPPAPPVVQAARFFIRSALLHPTATHYAALGLAPDAEALAIKERYRQLMRLLHPDFATSSTMWPADAATRINQAYEILSVPDRRSAYDEELTGPVTPPLQPSARPAPARPAAAQERHSPAADPRQTLRSLAMAFGAVGGIALIGLWFAGSQDRDSLVQRAATRVTPAKGGSLEPFSVTGPPVASLAGAPEAALAPASTPVADNPIAAAIARALPAFLASPSPTASVSTPSPEPDRPVATAVPARPPAAVATPVVADAPVASAPEPAPPPVIAVAAPVQAPAPTPVPAPAPVAQATPSPPPAASVAPRTTVGSPTIADVHPQLARLLQQIETGWGDNVIDILPDRNARGAASAQALARQIDVLFDGVRPVKVTQSDFRGEARDGRLFVTGQVTLQVRDAGMPTRQLRLNAEFADRNGAQVLTRLGPTP
jgi:DnaJ-domain-containing protein 1